MDVFLARQPILDREQELYGYELLYRSGPENVFNAACADTASSSVIGNSILHADLARITGGKIAFINVTDKILTDDLASVLPPEITVIELLESIQPTAGVIAACRSLRDAGYRLALDDFVYDPSFDPLIDIVAIVKLDWMALSRAERRRHVARLRPRKVQVLAEKIETWEDFRESMDLGCDLFQGYFFAKPELMRQRSLSTSKLNHLKILKELHAPDLDFGSLEELIKHEVALAYKLLRYVNSVAFGMRNDVQSIKHALVLLGEREFRRWASLAILSSVGQDKPDELLVQAAVRGRMCELLAEDAGTPGRGSECFILGMFSLLEAFLDQPLDAMLSTLAVPEEVRGALLGQPGPLRDILKVALGYERGHWSAVLESCNQLNIRLGAAPQRYIEAVAWADQSVGAVDEKAA
jgi:EAL and modified HD-GYP domain-containing signal transduction protein